MLSLITQDGRPKSLFNFSWRIFENYNILPIEDYIQHMETVTGVTFSDDDQRLLRDKKQKLGHTYVIFKTSNEFKEPPNNTRTPDAFLKLCKIINYNFEVLNSPLRPKKQGLKRIQSNILKWVNKYGLPYHSAFNLMTPNDTIIDDVRRSASEIEVFLEERFKHYGMLQETFLALAFEAYLANEIFNLKSESISENTVSKFIGIISRGNYIDISELQRGTWSRSELYARIREALTSLLEQRINGYSHRVSVLLECYKSTTPPHIQLGIKFEIPDLLTALWYQFITLVTDTGDLIPCKECGTLFFRQRSDREWCSNRCKTNHNQRERRRRIKEQAAGTQSE